jgi:RNA polymerase sigma factor (sigma-70 family)
MTDSDETSTSTTLLRQVAADPLDPVAWDEFVERYGRMVYSWCRRWNLQEADAEDVTQGVMLQLAKQMRSFRYDPNGRFRAWLRTVTHRAWAKFLEQRGRPGGGTGDTGVWRLLQSAPARDDFARRMEEEADREVLELAAVRVQARVMPHTWEAFRLLAVEGLSGREAAERTGMTVPAAVVARSKVAKMLREEVAKMTADPGDQGTGR